MMRSKDTKRSDGFRVDLSAETVQHKKRSKTIVQDETVVKEGKEKKENLAKGFCDNMENVRLEYSESHQFISPAYRASVDLQRQSRLVEEVRCLIGRISSISLIGKIYVKDGVDFADLKLTLSGKCHVTVREREPKTASYGRTLDFSGKALVVLTFKEDAVVVKEMTVQRNDWNMMKKALIRAFRGKGYEVELPSEA